MSTQDQASEAPEEFHPPSVVLADVFDPENEEKTKDTARHWKKHLASDVKEHILENRLCTKPMRERWETALETNENYAHFDIGSLKLQDVLDLSSAWFDFKKDKAMLEVRAQDYELKAKKAALKGAMDEMTELTQKIGELAQKIAELQEEVGEQETALRKAQQARSAQNKHLAEKYKGYLAAIRLDDPPPPPEETTSVSHSEERPPSPPPDESRRKKRGKRAVTMEEGND